MSKSLKNIYTLRNLEAKNLSPLAYRLWLLMIHYRMPANFTWEAVGGAQTAYRRLTDFVRSVTAETGTVSKNYQVQFLKFINNDLDLPQAVALAWQLIKDEQLSLADRRATLLDFDRVFGLDLASLKPLQIPSEVQELATAREAARQAQNWALADQLRAQIESHGYAVNDTPDGPTIVSLH